MSTSEAVQTVNINTRNPIDSLSRQIATSAITNYQKYISPHKGFCCAYKALYGKPSCSQIIKRDIQDFGLIRAIPKIREQFRACHKASQILKHQKLQIAIIPSTIGCCPSSCTCIGCVA